MNLAHQRPSGRPSPADTVTLCSLVLLAFAPVLHGLVLGGAGALLLATCLQPARGDSGFSRAARSLVGALCLYFAAGPALMVWPAYLVAPLLAAALFGGLTGFGQDLRATVKRGRLGATEWLLVGAIAVVAGVALVGWTMLLQPDLSGPLEMLPDWPLPALVGAGLFFSVVNAVLEEVIWRGVLQQWLLTFLAPVWAVAIQAVSFGAMHFTGFPSGWIGVGLAAIYGLMIGGLAVRSGGLLGPIVAHIAADAVIFVILARSLA